MYEDSGSVLGAMQVSSAPVVAVEDSVLVPPASEADTLVATRIATAVPLPDQADGAVASSVVPVASSTPVVEVHVEEGQSIFMAASRSVSLCFMVFDQECTIYNMKVEDITYTKCTSVLYQRLVKCFVDRCDRFFQTDESDLVYPLGYEEYHRVVCHIVVHSKNAWITPVRFRIAFNSSPT